MMKTPMQYVKLLDRLNSVKIEPEFVAIVREARELLSSQKTRLPATKSMNFKKVLAAFARKRWFRFNLQMLKPHWEDKMEEVPELPGDIEVDDSVVSEEELAAEKAKADALLAEAEEAARKAEEEAAAKEEAERVAAEAAAEEEAKAEAEAAAAKEAEEAAAAEEEEDDVEEDPASEEEKEDDVV